MKLRFSSPRAVALVMALVAAANIAPLLFFEFGGDIMFHYVAMSCFDRQLAAGGLYPRWCFGANAGLGSPVFVFYGPLPYYASALFYPLTRLGAGIGGIYLLSVWAATVITGITAWLWLRDITTPGRALLAAIIYLYLPYRMELLLFRSAYSELWCMAWLPLVFRYARRLAQGDAKALPWLALGFALTFLSNMPAAMIGVLASGLYMLLLAPKALPRYAAALAWSGTLTAFYLLPAMLYKPFVTTEGVIAGHRTWSNDFMRWANVSVNGQGHVVAMAVLTLLAVAALLAEGWRRRGRIEDAFCRREIGAWAGVFAFTCIMLFPVSRPVWDALPLMSLLILPWRMQGAIALCAAAIIATRMQWLISPKQLKTWKGDFIMLMALMTLMALFMVSTRPPDFVTYGKDIQAAAFITQREYRSVWTDKPFIAMDYILKRYRDRASIPRVQTLSGAAQAGVRQWDQDGVVLAVNASQPSVLRLALDYFPTWHVASGAAVTAAPEAHTGQLLLNAPAGDYSVTLTPRIGEIHPWLVAGADLASALTLCLLLLQGWRDREESNLRPAV